MKTLYESILDDEEVLTRNIVKDSQNPFIILKRIFDNIDFDNDKDGYRKWREACKKQISKIDLPKELTYYFLGTEIILKYKNTSVCNIRYDIINELDCDYICAQFCFYELDKNLKPRYRKIPENIVNWVENVFNVKYGFEDYSKNIYWKLIR